MSYHYDFDNENIFDVVQKARDKYKAGLKRADDSLSESLKRIKEDYRPSAAGKHIEEAKQVHAKEVDRLRFAFSQTVDDALKVAEGSCKSRLVNRDAGKFNELKMFREIPVTASELAVICRDNRYALDYPCSKLLRQIAEQNDIAIEDLPEINILPSLDEQLDVLDELKNECTEFIDTYSSKHEHLSDLDLLKDDRLTAWENRFTCGLRSVKDLSDDAKVRRLMSHVRNSSNEVDKGLKLKQALAECPDALRAEFISRVAESHTITDIALKLSGARDEILAFRNGQGTREYKNAVSAIEQIKSADSLDAKRIGLANKDNKYFVGALEREAVADKKVREVVEFINDNGNGETTEQS